MVRAEDGALHVWLDGRDVRVERSALHEPEQHAGRGPGAAAGGAARIAAPMPGSVLRLEVAEGDEVEERAVLLVLEAMKMEHPVWAPFAGRVTRLACREGQQVAAGRRSRRARRRARRLTLEALGEEAAGDQRDLAAAARRRPRRPSRASRS